MDVQICPDLSMVENFRLVFERCSSPFCGSQEIDGFPTKLYMFGFDIVAVGELPSRFILLHQKPHIWSLKDS